MVAWLVAVAEGHSRQHLDWLCAVVGLSYILAIVFKMASPRR
jgi:hypothetical protein